MKKFILSIVALALILGSFPTAMVSGQEVAQEESSAENGIELPQEAMSLEDESFESRDEIDSENDFYLAQDGMNIDPQAVEYHFRRSWGGEGDQIQYPRGIDLDDEGNLILANSGMSRITIINQFDNSVQTLGGSGTSPGEFDWPGDIAVSSDGSFFVADTGHHRIQHISKNGNPINVWGSQGSGEGQFSYPDHIALDKDDFVYVVDNWNNRIQKFSPTGDLITYWGGLGNAPGNFNSPGDIDVDDNGNVYVVDTLNHRIQKFDSNGNFISQFGNETLRFPRGIEIDKTGFIFVGNDGYYSRIDVYSPDGNLAGYLYDLWGDPEKPADISGFTIDNNGALYVTFDNYHEVVKFSSTAEYLRHWGSEETTKGKLFYPETVKITPSGDLLVLEEYNHRIQVFDLFGKLKRVVGSLGSGTHEFYYPYHVTTDRLGQIYVADSGNDRIQVFDQNWNFIRSIPNLRESSDSIVQMAVDSNGNIYGFNQTGLLKMDYQGNHLNIWEIERGPLYIDRYDNIYVVNNSIEQYDTMGGFVRSIGHFSDVYGEFNPWSITVDLNGNFYIADGGIQDRIIVLDSSGNNLASIGNNGYKEGEFNIPYDVTVSSSGDVYVADRDNHRIQVFSPQAIQPDNYSGLVQNGGFEKSPALMEWTTGGDMTVSRTSNRYQGSYGMRLGQPVPQEEQGQREAWAYTNFYVDPSWSRPVLKFKYKMSVNDILDYSDFFVAIQDGVGLNHLETVLRDGYNPCNPGEPPSAGQDLGWRSVSFDLSKYKGQHIRVNFSNRNLWPDISLGIWTDIDDVMVWDEGPLPYLGPYRTDLPLIYSRSCDLRSKSTQGDEIILRDPIPVFN